MSKVIFFGNDINNINNSTTSWKDLLNRIIKVYGNKIEISSEKPFPLLYEEIYLKALKSQNIKETELKLKIAQIIGEIKPNEIHEELLQLDCENYITTNYDYVLQKVLLGNKSTSELQNKGLIKETKYSVFRHNTLEDKKFWHAHGEINHPNSIALGFEHYGGQLQQFRNYTVSGTNYTNNKKNRKSLHRRLIENDLYNDSWIDLIFKEEIHILGLKLGYEETDLWWLLTNRARFQNEKKHNIKNRIKYYSPMKYRSHNKESIMNANDIETCYINEEGINFYKEVVKQIKNGN